MGKHSKTKDKPKRKVSNVMLVLICVMIIVYTAADFILQYFTSIEVSPTLTTAWFAFWGTEIIALTAIKTSKVIRGNDNTNTTTEDNTVINEEE